MRDEAFPTSAEMQRRISTRMNPFITTSVKRRGGMMLIIKYLPHLEKGNKGDGREGALKTAPAAVLH